MRNPISLLAVALALAVPALADLPTWTSTYEPWGSWRVLNFTDEAGQGHELWCRWSECNWNKTSGRAKLYVFERAGTEYYDYKTGFFSSTRSSKTTYSTMVSKYELDMTTKPHKAVIAGTALAFAVEDRPQLTPTGYLIRVLPPSRLADDAPAPAARPNPDQHKTPTPTRRRTTTRRPASSHRREPVGGRHNQPAETGAVQPLTELEKGWLAFAEKTAYETALASHKGAAHKSDRAQDAKAAREKVSANLADREGATKRYAALIAVKIDTAAIDGYLGGLDRYGAKDPKEIALTAEELAALQPVKDAAGKSQKAAYDEAIGKAAEKDYVLRHRITATYRALVPKTTPATPADGLTAAEITRLQQLGLYDAYQQAIKDAGGDPAKLAQVYADYRQKIAAAGLPHSLDELFRSRLTGDDLAAFNADLAKAKTDAEKNAVYDKYLAKVGAGLKPDDLGALPKEARKPFCDRIKANTKSGTAPAPARTAQDQARRIKECNQDQACISRVMEGKSGDVVAAGGVADGSLVASSRDLQALYTKCLALDESDTHPEGTHTGGSYTDSGINKLPGTDTNTAPPKTSPDPSFWKNLTQGMTGGFLGLVLGSFFGGPLVMVGAAAVLGVGAFYLSKHINAKKKDD